jgi:peroxiredoxin-like protein
MHPLPHHYVARAVAGIEHPVMLEGEGLRPLETSLPPEFGGEGGSWSPETMLVGAAADCYVLTFRGLAKRLNLPWLSLVCEANGMLDRVNRVLKFVEIHLQVRLQVPEGTDVLQANRLLARAEETCLITRSLTATVFLSTAIELMPVETVA